MKTVSHYKNISVKNAVLVLHIWDILRSNTDPDTGHYALPQSQHSNSQILPQIMP
jgi:hypothetical protein